MNNMVHFSFALSARMRAFIEVRDALDCLKKASEPMQPHSWLHAACDLRTSLLGEQGRKPALPEIIGLLQDMDLYLKKLIANLPNSYAESIQQARQNIANHITTLQNGIPTACNYLDQDALINAHLNAQKKHDWLGHKGCMQQSLPSLWHYPEERTGPLQQSIIPLQEAVSLLDHMLNGLVNWDKQTAIGGVGKIAPDRQASYGLIVIALPEEDVHRGIIPDITGNRLAIRIRFQQWSAGETAKELNRDQPYQLMLVPVGG